MKSKMQVLGDFERATKEIQKAKKSYEVYFYACEQQALWNRNVDFFRVKQRGHTSELNQWVLCCRRALTLMKIWT